MAILGISQPDGGSSQLQVGAGRRPRLCIHGGDEGPHSLSHHGSFTADLNASLGGGRRKTALRVVG